MDNSRERLSALVDGELDPGDADGACAAWRDDPGARATWHCYQLIGDVLRSDDLASTGPRDRAFLAGLRERLAAEPVVLAPVAAPAVRPRRRAWIAPAAAVAGFMAVAGVVVVMRATDPGTAAPAVAAAPAPLPVAVAAPAPAEETLTGPMLRDAGLDRYIRAHKQVAGPSALGNQGFLRNVTADGTDR